MFPPLASHLNLDAPARPPNIVLIMADDLGWGDVGFNGQTKIRTPNIDQMARDGMILRNAYAPAPVCAPTRCSLMTGLHTGHSHVRDNKEYQPEGQEPLPEGTLTLARALQQAGYVTGMFGKWGLGGPESSGEPSRQGFDRFYGYLCQRQAHNFYPTHLWSDREKVMLEGNVAGNVEGKQYAADLYAEQALQFIRDNRERPFFLYYPTTIPHVALQVPEDSIRPYLGKFPETPYHKEQGYQPHPTPHAAYAGMVSRMDREVGRVRSLLKELDLDRNTLIVFTSDNGPTYDRVGGADSKFFNSAGPYRGFKGDVYEGGIRAPFVAVWPGKIAPGTESDRLVALYDLMPTFLDLAGSKPPGDLDGVSILPTLLGDWQAPRTFLYWSFPGYGGQQAIRTERWKLLRRGMGKGNRDWELYDLLADPGESKNVAADNPDVVRRLSALAEGEYVPSKLFPMPGDRG